VFSSLNSTHIDISSILIEDDGFHILLSSEINGIPARMLIDTGASRTVFDLERIQQFVSDKFFEQHDKLSTGLGTDSMPTSTVVIKKLKIGDLELEDFSAVLLDLQHVNGTYNKLGHEAIDGVLGNDILVKYNAVINYKKLKLSLTLR
jgi:predicted aspartyl protease